VILSNNIMVFDSLHKPRKDASGIFSHQKPQKPFVLLRTDQTSQIRRRVFLFSCW